MEMVFVNLQQKKQQFKKKCYLHTENTKYQASNYTHKVLNWSFDYDSFIQRTDLTMYRVQQMSFSFRLSSLYFIAGSVLRNCFIL